MSNSFITFNRKLYVLIRWSWNFIGLLSTSSKSWIYFLFWWSHIFKGDNWHFLIWKKNFGFFLDNINVRSFKLCMIITLLGAYIVILGLMTLSLILFHCERCVRNINCALHVLDLCLLQFKTLCGCNVLEKDHAQYDLCDAGVYSRENFFSCIVLVWMAFSCFSIQCAVLWCILEVLVL